MQDAQGEATGAAQVVLAGQIGGSRGVGAGKCLDEVPHGGFGGVIDHDHMRHRQALRADQLQAAA